MPYATEAAEHLTDPIIDGWMQEDEPDNAQTDCERKLRRLRPSLSCLLQLYGYGGARYDSRAIRSHPLSQFKAADPNRPVYLGMGQGTGYNNTATGYNGRGSTCVFGFDGI